MSGLHFHLHVRGRHRALQPPARHQEKLVLVLDDPLLHELALGLRFDHLREVQDVAVLDRLRRGALRQALVVQPSPVGRRVRDAQLEVLVAGQLAVLAADDAVVGDDVAASAILAVADQAVLLVGVVELHRVLRELGLSLRVDRLEGNVHHSA